MSQHRVVVGFRRLTAASVLAAAGFVGACAPIATTPGPGYGEPYYGGYSSGQYGPYDYPYCCAGSTVLIRDHYYYGGPHPYPGWYGPYGPYGHYYPVPIYGVPVYRPYYPPTHDDDRDEGWAGVAERVVRPKEPARRSLERSTPQPAPRIAPTQAPAMRKPPAEPAYRQGYPPPPRSTAGVATRAVSSPPPVAPRASAKPAAIRDAPPAESQRGKSMADTATGIVRAQ